MSRKEDKGIIQPSVALHMLKDNKDVPKVAKGLQNVVAYTGELFLADMIRKVTNDGEKELNCDTIIQAIETTKEYDFLIPLIPEFREMADEEAMRKKKVKPEDGK